jgi:hypothetical protein
VSPAVRNVLIIVALAAAIFAIPTAGVGAGIIESLLHIGFAAAIWFILMRVYRGNRTRIFDLGERHRGLLYGGLAALLFLAAAASRWWGEGALTVMWFVVLGAAVYALVVVFRYWREYA